MKSSLLQIFLAVCVVFFLILLALTGLGFLIAALFLYLATFLTLWSAGLVTGGVILGSVVLFLLVTWLSMRLYSRSPPPPEPPQYGGQSPEFLALLQGLMKGNKFDAKELSLYALVAGGMLGASPELRRFLISLINAESKSDEPK